MKGLEPRVMVWADFGFDWMDLATARRKDLKRTRKKEGKQLRDVASINPSMK